MNKGRDTYHMFQQGNLHKMVYPLKTNNYQIINKTKLTLVVWVPLYLPFQTKRAHHETDTLVIYIHEYMCKGFLKQSNALYQVMVPKLRVLLTVLNFLESVLTNKHLVQEDANTPPVTLSSIVPLTTLRF